VLHQVAGHHLVEAGNVAQQRHAGGVQIHADRVDARLDDGVQRLAQLLGADVVLIEADADVLRVDLDQLAERVLQTAADGDGCAGAASAGGGGATASGAGASGVGSGAGATASGAGAGAGSAAGVSGALP